MAAWRRAIELSLGDADTEKLRSIAQSRTEPASRVERARILLAYREDPSFFAVGRALGLHHQTVQRCVERAVAEGPLAALDDRPRPGRAPTITLEAKAWLVSLACQKAKDLGYPHELWTTRLLAHHAREHGPAEGHPCLGKLAQGTVCKILNQEEVKPHKVRYYLEARDSAFAEKMAEVLCVYRQVKLLKKNASAAKEPSDAVAVISYDEKPGIQALATTAPDLPPQPGVHATFARDHEYKRQAGRHRPADREDPRCGQGSSPQPRVHRVPQHARYGLPGSHGDPPDSRQPFRAHLQGNPSLARRAARRSLRVHLRPQARFLAQSRRGLLLQARPVGPAPYPCRLQAGTQGPPDGRHRVLQRGSGRAHLELLARSGRLI